MDINKFAVSVADNATKGLFLFCKRLPLPMNEIVSFFVYPIGVVNMSIYQE